MAETCRLCQKSECETDLESLLCSTDSLHNCPENDMFSHVKTYLDCYRLVAMTEVHLNSQISNKLCNHCSKQLLNAYNFMKEAYHVERKLLTLEIKDPIEVPSNDDELLLALRNTEFIETCGSIPKDVLLTDRHTIEEVAAGMEETVNVDFISETTELNEHSELDEHLVCYACNGLEFPNSKELRHHLLHAHMSIIGNIKKCDLCGEVCRQRTKFLSHVRSHKKLPNTFKCISCENSEFVTHQDYMQHKIEAHLLQNATDTNYACQNCQTEFISFYNLRRHLIKYCTQPMLEHMPDVDLTNMSCKICHRKLSRLHSLLNHVKRHKQVRKTSTCDLCGKTLFLESSMLAHKRQHEQELKVFDVPKSNENADITTWNVEFTTTTTTTTKNVKPELKCKICNKQFVKLINLNRHVERHEEKLAEDASGPFSCNQCEKNYSCKRALNQHLRRHFNALFNCEYCDKKFINKKELQVHTRFHTRDYPFVCEICGQRYGVQSSLNEHLMRHQGVRYKCEECGKCFKKSCSLREHSRFHTGKMPYPCVYCDRAYTTKDKYRYHLKNKHNLQLNDEECMKSRKLAQQQADAD